MKRLLGIALCTALLVATIASTASASMHILGVMLRAQEKANWCWAASAQMVQEWNGVYKSQCAIVERVWGSCTADKQATIENVKASLYYMANLTSTSGPVVLRWDEVKLYIGKSQPFVFRHSESGVGHFMVAYGFEESSNVNNVHYNDPWPVNAGAMRVSDYTWLRGGTGYPHIWTHSLYNVTK